MKKLKIGIWLVIILFLGTVIYQNRDFFLAKESMGIDLIFIRYQSPELPVVLFFAGLFCLGWLLAYLFGLAERFRSGKQIKTLKQNNDAQQLAIDEMKRDIESLKPVTASGAETLKTEKEVQVAEQSVAPEPESEADPKAVTTEPAPSAEQN